MAGDGGSDGPAGRAPAGRSGLVEAMCAFLQIRRADFLPMVEMCLLMFLWGLANNLNDILIKQFKKAFELGNLEAGLVQTALYIGYFVGAPPAAIVANRHDYKTSILCGLALYVLGAALFYPAASVRVYGLFLGALLIIGLGLACLETSVSPYLIRFGPAETAARRINFAAVWNPCGSIVGILGGRSLVFSGVEWTRCSCSDVEAGVSTCGLVVTLEAGSTARCEFGREEFGCFVTPGSGGAATLARRACGGEAEVEAWRSDAAMATQGPYVAVAATVALAGLLVWQTSFPTYRGTEDQAAAAGPAPPLRAQAQAWLTTVQKLLGIRRFRNGVLAQFMYVGGQVGVWSYLIQYMQFNVADTSEKSGADHVFYSLLMLTLGRAASTLLLRFITDVRLMLIFGFFSQAILTTS